MYIKPSKVISVALITLICAFALWLSLRYLLPCFAPFVVAVVVARLIESPVRLLCRRGLSRELSSGICTIAVISLFFALVWAGLVYGAGELGSISGNLPRVLYSAGELISSVRQKIREYTEALPPEMGSLIDTSIGSLASFFATLPALISEQIIAFLSRTATAAPTILLFSITASMGIYFISASYPDVQCFFDTRLPQSLQQKRLAINSSLHFTAFRYLKAQLILMIITFFELLIAFFLLKIENFALMSFAVAIMDALPILGAGAVLIPWAGFALLLGDIATGVGILITWAVITVMRNALQAKLLGDQLGLHPLITLIAIYVGWHIAGVWGMVLFPMAALLLMQFLSSQIRGKKAYE